MKERPILFNTEMVKAILSGNKTQTRRIVKEVFNGEQIVHIRDNNNKKICPLDCDTMKRQPNLAITYNPFGQIGDRLWVRENFKVVETSEAKTFANESQCHGEDDQFIAIVNYADGNKKVCEDLYIDNDAGVDQIAQAIRISQKNGFSPNIHMPRWACRLVLEITDIRVERLNDISEADAKAEGVDSRNEFKSLWQSINGEASWDDNPWVWVVEFKVVEDV